MTAILWALTTSPHVADLLALGILLGAAWWGLRKVRGRVVVA